MCFQNKKTIYNETKEKKNVENLVFIVHYPNADETKYNGVKEIFVRNKDRIRVAKSERETYTDENFHRKQCASIPNKISHDKPGIHLEPCFKQFTLILAKSKEKLPAKIH